MAAREEAKKLHLEIVEAARRRNEHARDIEDPTEFEQFMEVLEGLGKVAEEAAGTGISSALVGRSMLHYAKCVAVATRREGTA